MIKRLMIALASLFFCTLGCCCGFTGIAVNWYAWGAGYWSYWAVRVMFGWKP